MTEPLTQAERDRKRMERPSPGSLNNTNNRLDPDAMLNTIRVLKPIEYCVTGVGWELVQDAGDVIEAMMDQIAELRGGDYD